MARGLFPPCAPDPTRRRSTAHPDSPRSRDATSGPSDPARRCDRDKPALSSGQSFSPTTSRSGDQRLSPPPAQTVQLQSGACWRTAPTVIPATTSAQQADSRESQSLRQSPPNAQNLFAPFRLTSMEDGSQQVRRSDLDRSSNWQLVLRSQFHRDVRISIQIRARPENCATILTNQFALELPD